MNNDQVNGSAGKTLGQIAYEAGGFLYHESQTAPVIEHYDKMASAVRDAVLAELPEWGLLSVVRRRLRPDSSPTEEQQHPEKEAGRERTRAEQAESERDQLRKELEDWRSDRKASSAAFRAHIKSTTAENAALKENLEAATHLVRRAVYAAEHLRDLSRCPGMVEWLKNADAFLGAQESPPETEEQKSGREFEAWAVREGLSIVMSHGQYADGTTLIAWKGYRAAKQSNRETV